MSASPDPWPFRPWVCVERAAQPESFHEGLLAVVDDRGEVRARWGDPSWVSYLRSSLKMIQALPLVESGAAEQFGLVSHHLALCCASHNGEPFHIDLAREILSRAGLYEDALRCGAHLPLHEPSRDAVIRSGQGARAIHNNCSGKHAGMLATCIHRVWDPGSYDEPEHPLQREIVGHLGSLAEVDPATIPHGIDGCGIPTFRLSVDKFALALARFVAGTGPGEVHRDAAGRIFTAMNRHPEMVGGTGRFCTEVVRAASRPILAKAGAEGFYAVAWREGEGRAVALVAKSAAGDSRSRDFAVTEALHQLGVLDDEGLQRLRPFHSGPMRNHGGKLVGRMVSLMDLAKA